MRNVPHRLRHYTLGPQLRVLLEGGGAVALQEEVLLPGEGFENIQPHPTSHSLSLLSLHSWFRVEGVVASCSCHHGCRMLVDSTSGPTSSNKLFIP